jgi:hypothetical protein
MESRSEKWLVLPVLCCHVLLCDESVPRSTTCGIFLSFMFAPSETCRSRYEWFNKLITRRGASKFIDSRCIHLLKLIKKSLCPPSEFRVDDKNFNYSHVIWSPSRCLRRGGGGELEMEFWALFISFSTLTARDRKINLEICSMRRRKSKHA